MEKCRKTNDENHPYKFSIEVNLPGKTFDDYKKIIPVIEFEKNILCISSDNETSALVILYFILDGVIHDASSIISNDDLDELYTFVIYDKEYLNQLMIR